MENEESWFGSSIKYVEECCCYRGWYEVKDLKLKSDSDSWVWWKLDILNQIEYVKAHMSNLSDVFHLQEVI